MKYILIIALLLVIVPAVHDVQAQVDISGLLDFAHSIGDNTDSHNRMFRGDNPFHDIRAKIFLTRQLREDIGVFIQLWYDDRANPSAGGQLRMEGAYIAFERLGTEKLGIMIGKIPSPVGTYAPRAYSDVNPLIGIPMMYSYRTPLSFSLVDYQTLLNRKASNSKGLPILYDSCWNVGINFFGTHNIIEYSAGLITGAVSNPKSAGPTDGYQITGRLGCVPHISTRFGMSFAYGPYASRNDEYPDAVSTSQGFGKVVRVQQVPQIDDYNQIILVADFEYTHSHLSFYSEGGWNRYENPQDFNVDAYFGYGELQYTLHPRLYTAGRFGWIHYADVRYSLIPSSNISETEAWGYNVHRYEFGIGIKITRNVQLKFVEQITKHKENKTIDTSFSATQLNIAF